LQATYVNIGDSLEILYTSTCWWPIFAEIISKCDRGPVFWDTVYIYLWYLDDIFGQKYPTFLIFWKMFWYFGTPAVCAGCHVAGCSSSAASPALTVLI